MPLIAYSQKCWICLMPPGPTGNSATLVSAVAEMQALKAAAQPLWTIPLPSPEDGFYGPDFKYIPQTERK